MCSSRVEKETAWKEISSWYHGGSDFQSRCITDFILWSALQAVLWVPMFFALLVFDGICSFHWGIFALLLTLKYMDLYGCPLEVLDLLFCCRGMINDGLYAETSVGFKPIMFQGSINVLSLVLWFFCFYKFTVLFYHQYQFISQLLYIFVLKMSNYGT